MTLRPYRGSLRAAMACGVLAALVLAALGFAAPAGADDLADLIPNLFNREIFLKPPGAGQFDHSAHFVDESDRLRATGNVINQALASQLSTFPIASTSGGFTYSYDESVGSFTRSSESFGPLFTERAQTIGKGKWNVGFSYLSASYDSIDDLDLGGGGLVFHLLHADTNNDAGRTNFFFEGDVIEADTIIDLESQIATAFFTYGINDRFDVAIAAPMVSVDLEARARLTVLPLATTGSTPPFHIFDDDSLTREFADDDSSSGIGDLLVRGKYRLTGEKGSGWALAADVRLPTGAEEDLQGTGATQVKAFVIGSHSWGSFSPHINLGYTFSSGGSDLLGDVPDEINYALGLDWAVHPRVTLNAEFVGRTLQDTIRLEAHREDFPFCTQRSTAPGAPVCAPGATAVTQLPELEGSEGDLDLWLGAAGLRFNPTGNLLVSANLLFSLSDEGLQNDDVFPVVSLDYSF
jgi:outer membrane putative beta-barrel porin/alpha-amylase